MTAYERADAAYKAAFAIYAPVRRAYLAGRVTDAEYLAARAVFERASAAFDVAYAAAESAAIDSGCGL